MWTKLNQRLVAFVLVSSALAGVDVRAAQAQGAACTAYEHRDYKGVAKTLNPNQSANRSGISDKISSFRIIMGCRVVAYENENFRGPNAQWSQSVPYVGDNWNDLISSWRCLCN
jgi:hypothetical protein